MIFFKKTIKCYFYTDIGKKSIFEGSKNEQPLTICTLLSSIKAKEIVLVKISNFPSLFN